MGAWMRKPAGRLYRLLSANHMLRVDETRGWLSGLYGGNRKQTEELTETYYIQMIQKVMLCICVGIVLMVMVTITYLISDDEQIHIVRSDYGDDSEQLTLYYEDFEHHIQPVEVEIEPVKYREEDLEGVFDQGFVYLEEFLPGENGSLENVTDDLQLETSIPGSGLTVNWISDDYEYLSDDGRIHNDDLNRSVEVHLTAELSYGEEVRRRQYTVQIIPKDMSDSMQEQAKVKEILEAQLQEHSYEQEINLSAEQDGYHFSTTGNDHQEYLVIIFGTIAVILLLISHYRSRLKEHMKERKRQLQLEYSYFMNQILLYISAGTSVQGAILRIITQYERNHKEDHVLYQELVRMKNEIHTGTSAEQAYIHFGRRTGVISYIKAMALLTRQMKVGSQGVTEQLEQEEHEAFEHRKEMARKSGEEAGTKLLLPMIVLMIVSMVLVMYPAFASFSFEFL